MTTPDLMMRERRLIEAFRHTVEQRARGQAEADGQLATAREAAEKTLQMQRTEAQQAWRAAESASREKRDAAVGAADQELKRVRQKVDSRIESIRALCEGAHTALGLADLRYMEEEALIVPPVARPDADPDRELARCAGEAQKAARRIDTGSQELMHQRFKRKRLYPRLVGVLVVLLLLSTIVVQQGFRACGPLQTALGNRQSCTQTLHGHTGVVNGVAFSPQGTLLASVSADRSVRLWSVQKDKMRFARALAGHTSYVQGVAVSPDGTLIASAADDKTVKLWDAATGRELRTLAGHTEYVLAVAFSPSGAALASASADGTVIVWDVAGGQPLQTLSGHDGGVRALAFSPDGRRIASAGEDGTVRVWDAASGQQLLVLQAHAGSAAAVAFSPDGATLASGGVDGTLKLWSAASGTPLRTIAAHRKPVRAVAFSADGRTVASGSEDRTVKLWSAATGRAERTLHADGRVWSVAFSADGRHLAWGDDGRSVQIWNVR